MPPRRQVDVVIAPVMRSRAMRDLDRLIQIVSPKEVSISLSGESGTGKEVLARRIHQLSPRSGGPFVPINCAAVPELLFESELFGHERGAFTGATARALGKLEAAQGGTLFLDEIGEMPMAVQAKLLRFLENRRFMRVGGTKKVEVDTRVVSATLRPLEEEVRAGRFRADLFYRIQGVTLDVPPLRDRERDLPVLVEQFLREFATKHAMKPARLGRGVSAALAAHMWPGNVRELRNVVEFLTLVFGGRTVKLRDLPQTFRTPRLSPVTSMLEVSLDVPLAKSVDAIVDAALALESGNRVRAAARLGISLRTLQRRKR